MYKSSIIAVVQDEYGPLLPSPHKADAELQNWRCAIAGNSKESMVLKQLADLPSTLDSTNHLYPNIHAILKVLLTMPVSTASAERSFSVLKRLKTYLRNTMGDDRMSSLALLHIYQDRDINVDNVLQAFDASGHRRISMLFDIDNTEA